MKILVLNGSSRENGNTETLADLVVQNLPHTKINLRDKRILPIVDKRHTEEGFQPVADDYDEVIAQVLAHERLILATPIYWYGMSGEMKNFVDRWSHSLRDKRYPFKEEISKKIVHVIAVGGDQPRFKGLPLIQQFQYILDFVNASFAGYIIGEGNKPGNILQDQQALHEAELLHKKLQEIYP